MSHIVGPETDRLTLPTGEWLLVKRRLNMGEYRAHLTRSSVPADDGTRRIDWHAFGLSLVLAYLLDWSLADDGHRIPIHGLDLAARQTVLDHLDPDTFFAIKAAIDTHVAFQDSARAEQKKTAGSPPSSPTSPSPDITPGPTSTSPLSTLTSTA